MVKEFTEELYCDIPGDVLNDFHVHLLSLLDSFNCYFPEELHENIKKKLGCKPILFRKSQPV